MQGENQAARAAGQGRAQIQPSQLQGRWLISSMDGGSVDASMVQTHELEFSADQVRSVFIDSKGSGQGGIFAWRVSGSTLTLVVDPFTKATRSARISISGSYLVIEAEQSFPGVRRLAVPDRGLPEGISARGYFTRPTALAASARTLLYLSSPSLTGSAHAQADHRAPSIRRRRA
jgi:hypothetical protein